MTLKREWTVTSGVDAARSLRITMEDSVLTLSIVVDGQQVTQVQMNEEDQAALAEAAREALVADSPGGP